MSAHSLASLGARHPIHNYEYADAAARTGASGFVAADLGKVARQNDNDSFWALTATTPTWIELTGMGTSHALGGATHTADTLANLNSKVSDATLDDAGSARPPTAHSIASHSDTTATGAELETLTDGSNADALHTHAAALPAATEVAATGDTTTTSSTPVLVDSMTVTPAAGTYLVSFSSYFKNSTNNGQPVDVFVFVGGAQSGGIAARMDDNGAGAVVPCSIVDRKVVVNGSQAIEIKWQNVSGTATMGDRHMTITEVAA